MESIHDLALEIQKRLSDLGREIKKGGVSKPETKSLSALVRGLIQTRQVMVMPVVRVLGEKIAPKKTWEQLTRNMGKEGLWKRLLSAHREQQRGVIRKMPYCVIDLSDIQPGLFTKKGSASTKVLYYIVVKLITTNKHNTTKLRLPAVITRYPVKKPAPSGKYAIKPVHGIGRSG